MHVMYDIVSHQRKPVTGALNHQNASRIDLAPLVQARLARIDGQHLANSDDNERQRKARDEHKLTYAANNIDDVTMVRGRWWATVRWIRPKSCLTALDRRQARAHTPEPQHRVCSYRLCHIAVCDCPRHGHCRTAAGPAAQADARLSPLARAGYRVRRQQRLPVARRKVHAAAIDRESRPETRPADTNLFENALTCQHDCNKTVMLVCFKRREVKRELMKIYPRAYLAEHRTYPSRLATQK